MRSKKQFVLMALTLRGLCSSRLKTMRFANCEDTFVDMWDKLSPEVQAEWIALTNTIDTLFLSDDFQKDTN